MKNRPLAFQIWMICVAVTGIIFLLVAAFLPLTLSNFFTRQVFNMLRESQPTLGIVEVASSDPQPAAPVTSSAISAAAPLEESYTVSVASVPTKAAKTVIAQPTEGLKATNNPPKQLAGNPADNVVNGQLVDDKYTFSLMPFSTGAELPMVRHLVFGEGFDASFPAELSAQFAEQIKEDAGKQVKDVQDYRRGIGDKTLFYVIRKSSIDKQPIYAVSYLWGTYRNDMIKTMYWRLLILMVALSVLSWFPSMGLARNLTRPLTQMEKQTQLVAEHDWHQPFILNRYDEIGSLARAFEQMRQKLVRQDKAQRDFLNSISHELKTPVMVIHSYAQSMLDGIYPWGSQEESIKVIIDESERLENRVRDLLYINKLNYLADHEMEKENLDLSHIINKCIERFQPRRPELIWDVNLEPVWISGQAQQWEVGVENLFDNQVRYAASRVTVSAVPNQDPGLVCVRIWNDGPEIAAEHIDHLFEMFNAGNDGEFGLGMAILKRVADLHTARVWANNEDNGVAFYIELSVV